VGGVVRPPRTKPRQAPPVRRARWQPPRRWGRPLAVVLALVLVAALMPGAHAEGEGGDGGMPVAAEGLGDEAAAENSVQTSAAKTQASPDDAADAGGDAAGGGVRTGEQEQQLTREPVGVANVHPRDTGSHGAADATLELPVAAGDTQAQQQERASSGDEDMEAPTELALAAPTDRGGGHGRGRPPGRGQLPEDEQSAPDAPQEAGPSAEQTVPSPAGMTEPLPDASAPLAERVRAADQAIRSRGAYAPETLRAWHQESLELREILKPEALAVGGVAGAGGGSWSPGRRGGQRV